MFRHRPSLHLKSRILLAYAVMLAAGACLSALVLFNGNAVLAALGPLVAHEIPKMEAVARLKEATDEIEPILYEYYATTDRRAFRNRMNPNEAARQHLLAVIGNEYRDDTRLPGILAGLRELAALETELDRNLSARDTPPDWDGARATLVRVTSRAREVARLLDELSREAHHAVRSAANTAEEKTRLTMLVVVAACLALVVGSGFVALAVHRFLVEAASRRRLALFVERNPNPVLRLDSAGEIESANPSAFALADALGLETIGPRGLLPDELARHLANARDSTTRSTRFEHHIGNTVLGIGLHHVPEFDVYHVFLSDITAERAARARVEYLAYFDALTGVPNRASFERDIEIVLKESGDARELTLLVANIDDFRAVIQSFGAHVADVVLVALARRLEQRLAACADACRLYRLDGDTFAILVLSGASSGPSGASVSDGMSQVCESPFEIDVHRVFLSLCVGIAERQPDDTAASIVRKASAALSEAKRSGGHSTRVFDRALDDAARERTALQSDLRGAETRGELFVEYQPQLDLASGRIVGAEALLRWRHPRRGLISPAEFIPLAEESALILPIGRWVLATAAVQTHAWRARGFAGLRTAVNVSPRQFAHVDFLRDLRAVLDETGVDPDCLELEITESTAMQDIGRTVELLETVRSWGISLSIDDFGTGFSSLNHLKRLPLDKLKVDQSFVAGLPGNPQDRAIAQAILDLGRRLRLRIVAEGVETTEQLAWLRAHGCYAAQGYLIARPQSPDAFEHTCMAQEARAVSAEQSFGT